MLLARWITSIEPHPQWPNIATITIPLETVPRSAIFWIRFNLVVLSFPFRWVMEVWQWWKQQRRGRWKFSAIWKIFNRLCFNVVKALF
jgi:hypothetical protein